MAELPRLRVLSTLAVRGVLDRLGEFRPDPLGDVTLDLAPTAILLRRIAVGERADVGILTAAAVDDLMAEGIMVAGSRVDLADSPIGIAVRAGAPRPAIATLAEFEATLRAASSLVYSRAGASGIFFAGLIERLGLSEVVGRKAVVIPSGYTAESVAKGEAELAIQQVSELMVVPGVEVVGRLPEGAQQISTFSGGVFTGSTASDAARELLRSLADPRFAPLYETCGLIPPARRA